MAELAAAEYLFPRWNRLDSRVDELADHPRRAPERLAAARSCPTGERPGPKRNRAPPLGALADGARGAGAGNRADVRAGAEQFCRAGDPAGQSVSRRTLGEIQHELRLRGRARVELAADSAAAAVDFLPAARGTRLAAPARAGQLKGLAPAVRPELVLVSRTDHYFASRARGGPAALPTRGDWADVDRAPERLARFVRRGWEFFLARGDGRVTLCFARIGKLALGHRALPLAAVACAGSFIGRRAHFCI